MSRRTRKRQVSNVALALAPIVEVYLERIEWALTYGSNIVVFSNDLEAKDHNYVRQVKDHPRPQTLQIGPINIEEVDELVTFIRGRIDFSSHATAIGEQLTAPEFFYPARTVLLSPVDDTAQSDSAIG